MKPRVSTAAARPQLEALARLLAGRPEVRLAVAFGSWARGQGHPDSDLDILLDLDPDTEELRRDLEPALGRAAGWEVDIVYSRQAAPMLRFHAARDGLVLEERATGDWTRFKARAMVDWWDWAPLARRIHAAAVHRLRQEEAASGRR